MIFSPKRFLTHITAETQVKCCKLRSCILRFDSSHEPFPGPSNPWGVKSPPATHHILAGIETFSSKMSLVTTYLPSLNFRHSYGHEPFLSSHIPRCGTVAQTKFWQQERQFLREKGDKLKSFVSYRSHFIDLIKEAYKAPMLKKFIKQHQTLLFMESRVGQNIKSKQTFVPESTGLRK